VYGRIADPPADEETPCHPNLVYERSKFAGEQAVLAAASETGLDTVVLRPTWVYGPGCPRTERLFRAIGKGRFIVAGNGQSQRHCIYISDMVEAFLLAARADAAVGKTIIVGDAGAVSIRELVDEVAPGFSESVLQREVLAPPDLERIFGITGGNIFHGAMSLDRLLFLRPAPGWARYRTPVSGLYLCGAGTHPGGGVMGACGRNAAGEILRDLRLRSVF
jgi:nucleoside-diphosphate-sugar epimerase